MFRLSEPTLAHELLIETFGELTEGGRRPSQLAVLLLQSRDLGFALFQELNTVIVAHTSFSPRVVLTKIATRDVPADDLETR